MRQYCFKVFEETDGDIIELLDSCKPGRQRSNKIREALRFYKQSKNITNEILEIISNKSKTVSQ